jgi:excisionase family DNA binding protein
MAIEDLPRKPGVSIPELSAEFGVSETLLYNLANSGHLPGARRLGKRIVIHRETFEQWLRDGRGA